MLQIERLSKSFGSTHAVKGVSFSAEEGEVVALIGENGSGKSTLLKMLAGEVVADEGRCAWNARPLAIEDVHLVHQELLLCPHITVAENLFLGMNSGVRHRPKQLELAAQQVLGELGFPEIKADAITGSLPISQRQVIEIGRALVRNSPIILLDEPTSSLTEADKTKLYALIERLKAGGKLVIFISHFLEEIRSVCDQAVILRDGAFVAEGSLSELSDETIIRHMVGREIEDLFPRSVRIPGDVVLNVAQLTGEYGKPIEVDLQVRAGEVVGLAGLNGAGKTEVVRSAFLLRSCQSGRITAFGERIRSIRNLWRNRVGFVSEERKSDGISLQLGIGENITMPTRSGVFNRPTRVTSAAAPWIERLGIVCQSTSQPVANLSGGNQQKVAFARLLHADAKLLILDEPTRGVDVGSKAEIYQLIDEAARNGAGVLIASSYLPELLGVCDRIGVMNRGRLTGMFDARTTSSEVLGAECVR